MKYILWENTLVAPLIHLSASMSPGDGWVVPVGSMVYIITLSASSLTPFLWKLTCITRRSRCNPACRFASRVVDNVTLKRKPETEVQRPMPTQQRPPLPPIPTNKPQVGTDIEGVVILTWVSIVFPISLLKRAFVRKRDVRKGISYCETTFSGSY